jgi:hypothetical protein
MKIKVEDLMLMKKLPKRLPRRPHKLKKRLERLPSCKNKSKSSVRPNCKLKRTDGRLRHRDTKPN